MAESTTNNKPLFAEFGVRMFAFGLDLFLFLLLLHEVLKWTLPALSNSVFDHLAVLFLLLTLYFAAFWASPMKATPAQFLFGMRVVALSGGKLPFGSALIRAAVVVAMYVSMASFFRDPGNAYLAILAIVGIALAFPAIVTPDRQGVHDMLAQSIVVNRTSLNSTEQRERLQRHTGNDDNATRGQRRPGIGRMLTDSIVLTVLMVMIWNVSLVTTDRNMRARVAYAVQLTGALKAGVQAHYEAEQCWPGVQDELYVDKRGSYPDGGYFELEDDGVIRIRFEVRRELTDGSIVLEPRVSEDDFDWSCHAEGNIPNKYLPAACRS